MFSSSLHYTLVGLQRKALPKSCADFVSLYPSAMNESNSTYFKINSNEQYHADVDIYSSTMLKHAIESPATFIQSLLKQYTSTKATDLGTLMHTLILEPSTVNDVVAVFPDELTRSKECKEFKDANPGRYCITLREFIAAQKLADKVLSQSFRGRPFHEFVSEGQVEHSIYYTDPVTGLKCRTRPDLKHPEFTFDLKTTRFYELGKFDRQAIDLHYDLSAYMYTLARFLLEKSMAQQEEVIKPKPFVLVAICTEAPHSVFFRPTSTNFIENGKKKYENAVAIIKACSQVQSWPAMGGEEEIDIAPWQTFSSNIASNFSVS